MLIGTQGEIKLPNGQVIVDWQYYRYWAWKNQIDYINKLKSK